MDCNIWIFSTFFAITVSLYTIICIKFHTGMVKICNPNKIESRIKWNMYVLWLLLVPCCLPCSWFLRINYYCEFQVVLRYILYIANSSGWINCVSFFFFPCEQQAGTKKILQRQPNYNLFYDFPSGFIVNDSALKVLLLVLYCFDSHLNQKRKKAKTIQWQNHPHTMLNKKPLVNANMLSRRRNEYYI